MKHALLRGAHIDFEYFYVIMWTMDDNKITQYKYLIDEAHRRYDKYDKVYQTSKERVLLLLTAEIAILALLFKNRLDGFPSDHLVTSVFWVSAICGILFASCELLYNYRSRKIWPVPIGDSERIAILNAKNELAVLKVIEEDYRESSRTASALCDKIAAVFNRDMLILIICDIMILVINICS